LPKVFRGKYETKVEFPERQEGYNIKKRPSREGYKHFLGQNNKTKQSTIEKEAFCSMSVKCGRQRDENCTNYRELTYWYEAMVSFILWNEYTVKSSSLEIKPVLVNLKHYILGPGQMDSNL